MAEAKTKPAAPKAATAAKPKAAAPKAKAAAKPATTAKKAPAAKKTAAAKWNPSNEERYNMIQVAAYYLAERDDFAGNPLEYWSAAELQIRGVLPSK